MDLRLLTTFCTVAELGSVSGAAEALHVTQPALSRQLQQLERQVAVALFHRHHRRLTLTAAGHAFLAAARDVIASAEAARSLADTLAAGRLQRVRVAAPATTLTDILAPFLATLGPDDPLITVAEANAAEAVAGLGEDLDLALLAVPSPRGLASAPVARLPVWAYFHADHRYATGESVDVTDLADERLLSLESTARPRSLLDEALAAADVAPIEVIDCASSQVAQALAAAGRGVAVVSDDPRFDLARAHIRGIDGRAMTLSLTAAWNPRHHAAEALAQLAERLADFCRQRYGELATD